MRRRPSVAGRSGDPVLFLLHQHSTKDQEFADRLYAGLQSNAVRCRFAPHDIAGGRKVHEQIDEATRVYDRLLLILSKASMNSSWMETEISKARKRELREGRQMLFPVRLVEFQALRDWECFDADTGKDSAREIREYFIPDFNRWKEHDSYKAAFDGLFEGSEVERRGADEARLMGSLPSAASAASTSSSMVVRSDRDRRRFRSR
jgi:hypothetical protein